MLCFVLKKKSNAQPPGSVQVSVVDPTNLPLVRENGALISAMHVGEVLLKMLICIRLVQREF